MVHKHIAPLTRKTLNTWVTKGWIRSAKFGESQQSRRLFLTQDVIDALDRMAVGKQPRKRTR